MAVTVLTKTDASLGRVKSDASNRVAYDLDTQVPAAEVERWKDALIEHAGSINTILASSGLIWEWNQTDTTQFEGTDAYADAGASLALSVVADTTAIGGNKLRTTADCTIGGGFDAAAVRLLTQTFPFTAERQRLRVELDFLDNSLPLYFGIAFLADKVGAYYGYHLLNYGPAGWRSRADGIAIDFSDGATPYGYVPDGGAPPLGTGRVVLHLDLEKKAATRPRFVAEGHAAQGGSNILGIYARQSDYAGTPAAGWTSVVANRIGIIAQGVGTGTIDLAAMRIYRE